MTGLSFSAALALLLLGVTGSRCRMPLSWRLWCFLYFLFPAVRKISKKDMENRKVFVRIVQIDKGGAERVSKVIKAVRE